MRKILEDIVVWLHIFKVLLCLQMLKYVAVSFANDDGVTNVTEEGSTRALCALTQGYYTFAIHKIQAMEHLFTLLRIVCIGSLVTKPAP